MRMLVTGLLILIGSLAQARVHIASDIEGDTNRFNQFVSDAHLENPDEKIVIAGDLVGLSDPAADNQLIASFVALLDRYGSNRVRMVAGNRELVLYDRLENLARVEPLRYRETVRFLKSMEFFIREDQTLILHGAVTEQNFRYHPETREAFASFSAMYPTLRSWFHSMNLRAIRGDLTARRFLRAYGQESLGTPKFNQTSLIYGRLSERTGQQELPPAYVREFFEESGVNFMIGGHTPIGTVPVFLSANGFGIMTADISRENRNQPKISLDGRELTVESVVDSGVVHMVWRIGDLSSFGGTSRDGVLIGETTIGGVKQGAFYETRREVESGKASFKNELRFRPFARSCREIMTLEH